MSRFFIEYRDGIFVDHPVAQENLELIYSGFDPDNPVVPYVEFFETIPKQKVFEVAEDSGYVMADRGAERLWVIRPMTPEEKAAKAEWIMGFKPEGDFYFDEESGRWKQNFNQSGSPPDVIG